ncbi:hypothetical protein [Kitasatospora sp. NPDC097643]|uniref:hypothetical protein n=1 Tax=Kitasatospora sp. NPDC097643 TaxID=3157230 RepID=UPI003324CD99
MSPQPAAGAEPGRAPQPRPLPAGRAALFAGAGTALGTAGHHLATDAPFRAGPVLLGATLLFAAALPAARRPRSQPFWLAWTLAAQGLLHLLLPAAPAVHTAAGHVHHLAAAGTRPAGGPHGGTAMTAAHLLGALLVAVLVHRADRVWWTLPATLARAARRLCHRTVRPLSALRPVSAKRRRPHFGPPPALPRGRLLLDALPRRGPPAGHAFA